MYTHQNQFHLTVIFYVCIPFFIEKLFEALFLIKQSVAVAEKCTYFNVFFLKKKSDNKTNEKHFQK